LLIGFGRLPVPIRPFWSPPVAMNYVEKPVRNASWLRFLPQFLQARLSGRHHLQAALGNSGWLGGDRVIRMFGAVIASLKKLRDGLDDFNKSQTPRQGATIGSAARDRVLSTLLSKTG
jgi:hypothetical protein